MDTIARKIVYKGKTINIHYDHHAQSPDNDDSDVCFIVYDHRQFCVQRKGFEPDDIFEAMEQGEQFYNGYYFFPVFAYIHSGVALSLGKNEYPFTCNWDTSFKGFAMVTNDEYVKDRAHAYQIAKSLVESWNEYLSGQVYGYEVEETGDSCWGFYGKQGMDDAIHEAKVEIDWFIKKQTKKHIEKLKKWIKNHVPLNKRLALTI